MSEGPKRGESENEQDSDTGEPIRELAGWELNTSDAFLTLVRRKIQRRSTVSQLASFSWNVPKMILTEFWNSFVQILGSNGTKKEEQP